MSYLVWDPGEMTGWAMFNGNGVPTQFGRLKYGEELNTFLSIAGGPACDLFIIEEYMLRTKRSGTQHWTPENDRIYAARAIGAIERRAHEIGAHIHWQYPSQLGPASQAFDLSLTGFRSAQHPIDAILHGLYYAWKNLGILPPDRPVESTPPPQDLGTRAETRVVQVSSLGDLRKAARAVEKHRKTGRPLK